MCRTDNACPSAAFASSCSGLNLKLQRRSLEQSRCPENFSKSQPLPGNDGKWLQDDEKDQAGLVAGQVAMCDESYHRYGD